MQEIKELKENSSVWDPEKNKSFLPANNSEKILLN